MVTPDKSPTPVEYTLQGLAGNSATGQAGTLVPAVIRGTGLTVGRRINLENSSTSSRNPVWPQSVNADGTALNVLVDTRNLAPGHYDLVRDGMGYTQGQPSPGYVPNAFEVTAADNPAKSRFVPLDPARLLDTRDGTGAPKARVGAGQSVGLRVAGVKGVPADGVTAVVMNLTAASPTATGWITVHADGRPLPATSNLNFTAGRTVANLVTVPVVNGKVDLRNSAGTVDLIADVAGYYSATGTSTFSPATPQRLLDTRDGTGARQGAVGAGGLVSVQVGGVGGVPYGATAVLLNVTVTNPTDTGYLTAYPHGTDRPGTSSLNWTPGQTVSHQVLVPVVDGRVVFYNSTGTVNVTADLTGWFTA
ncbi:hypothetical protein [Kitasatospora griseola]|uniref:hypothetical protein n=1 Tax=Kitasatospora griseola TaxID=2064 RepID=UPI00167067E4|nr:hypothetical protein [Kitasatospora griseola]GGQ66826.1 hypothetical protein GCM10010195_22910 [Kitasatospora griseola]